ncbi:MAG: GNAT family N-acetyltransferase [Bacteroidota bacterium]
MNNKSEANAYHLQQIPSYLDLMYYGMEGFHKKTILELDMAGNGIFLDSYPSISEFVQNELSKSFRKNLKRSIERFEHCFDVTYKMYCGAIKREDYNMLMDKLREMYLLRFEQLGKTNVAVFTWGGYYEKCYKLINSKKASLLVIYADNKPVDISLAFHYDKLFFSVVSSYDLDYAKFSLGHISIYKEVEWCFENGYMLYDLSYGADMPYKDKWANMDYAFENHIVYKRGSLKGYLGFLNAMGYAFLKNTLYKFSKLYLLYDKIKQRKIIAKSLENINYISKEYHRETVDALNVKGLVDFQGKGDDYARLQKPINDFLYTHRIKKDELKIFKNGDSENEFYLAGPTQMEKIWF